MIAMKRLPIYQYTWAIRAFVALACLLPEADCASAQQTVFDESVFRKWREYEEFSRRIQAKARRTISGLELRTTERSYAITYKQNPQCAMYCANLGWDKPIYEFCSIANPRYAAEIKRNISDHGDTLLRDYKEDPNAILPYAGESVFDVLFLTLSPHFTFHNARLSDVVLKPSFKVHGVAKELRDGEELIRVDHSYIYDLSPDKLQYRLRGSIYFDPARCWCIRRIKESEECFLDGSLNYKTEVEVRHEVTDHPSGFPLIKTRTLFRNGYSDVEQKKKGGTLTENYETEVNENLPNEAFTLSAFGLPEPAGMEPVKKPLPLYIWILLAAGACGALALVFRHLARRRRLAATA